MKPFFEMRVSKYRYLRALKVIAYVSFVIVFIRALLIYFSDPITHQEYIQSLNGLPVVLAPWIRGLFMLQIHGPAGETAIYMFLSSFLPAFICGLVFGGTDYVRHSERYKQRGIVISAALMIIALCATIFIVYLFYNVAPSTSTGSRLYLNLFSPVFAVATPVVIATFCYGGIMSAFHLTLKTLSLAR